MTIEECCQLLGVSAGASQDEIKKAFKQKARVLHPDAGGNEEEFKKLNEAMQILSGKQKPAQHEQPFSGVDLGDLFGGRGFDFDPFHNVFRQQRQQEQQRFPEHDKDIQINFRMTAEDVRQGRTMKVTLNKAKTCDVCNGQGAKSKQHCASCNGTGQLRRNHQQGNMTWINMSSCNVCLGRGSLLIDPCKKCESTGQIVFQEHMIIEVKEKK